MSLARGEGNTLLLVTAADTALDALDTHVDVNWLATDWNTAETTDGVPVHASKGENPIKAGGRLMVIDGGFSEAYHNETGIAGYTLVYHSRGFQLVQHEPFTSARDAIVRETDIKSTTQIVEMSSHRMLVADTDKGEELRTQVADLKNLLYAYRHGILKEKRS